MNGSRLHQRIDVIAACASFTCAVHCVLTPILLGAGAMFGIAEILPLPVEIALFIVAVTVCAVSTVTGYRIHGRAIPLGLWAIGAVLIAIAFLFGEHADLFGEHHGGLGHGLMLGTAGALLGAGHLANRFFLNRA